MVELTAHIGSHGGRADLLFASAVTALLLVFPTALAYGRLADLPTFLPPLYGTEKLMYPAVEPASCSARSLADRIRRVTNRVFEQHLIPTNGFIVLSRMGASGSSDPADAAAPATDALPRRRALPLERFRRTDPLPSRISDRHSP